MPRGVLFWRIASSSRKRRLERLPFCRCHSQKFARPQARFLAAEIQADLARLMLKPVVSLPRPVLGGAGERRRRGGRAGEREEATRSALLAFLGALGGVFVACENGCVSLYKKNEGWWVDESWMQVSKLWNGTRGPAVAGPQREKARREGREARATLRRRRRPLAAREEEGTNNKSNNSPKSRQDFSALPS